MQVEKNTRIEIIMSSRISLVISLSMFTILLAEAQVATYGQDDQITIQQLLDSLRLPGKALSGLSGGHIPEGTKSFAIAIYDEDAPKSKGGWHWLVFNFDFNGRDLDIKRDSVVKNASTIYSRPRYHPASFGGGFHKYTVKVYALKGHFQSTDIILNSSTVDLLLEQNTIQCSSMIYCLKR